ncbi:MAG: dCTP deaminase [Candidatus Micrarchaeota archaeon]|nr:dCTP deaminase [Candidatus Micrarchaeota archaeon]
MILSNEDIRKLISKGRIRIEPLSPEQMGPASVDLTLAGRFWKFRKPGSKKIDLSKVAYSDVTEEIRADSMELAPGELCLGITEEKITLPPDIMGRLEGRSRYARMGLAVHVTSSLVQPGSDNHQVLEIVNLSPFRLVIHKGMRISQVVFEKLESPTSAPYAKFGKIAREQ